MNSKLLITASIFQVFSFADCSTLKSCIEEASLITGKKYIASKELSQKKVSYLADIKLDGKNTDLIISTLLKEAGYSRINIDEENILVIPSRDIRYHAMEKIIWTGNTDDIPKLNDYFLVSFSIKHQEGASSIARSLRPFISRYGRIIDSRNSPFIIVQDTGTNLRRIASLISELDVPLTKEDIQRIRTEDRKDRNNKEVKHRIEKTNS